MTVQAQAYPKVASAEPLPNRRLLVTFDNGVCKVYDCTPLLVHTVFKPLRHEWLFRLVQVDSGGYGVIWSDEIDLSEAELWDNGRVVESVPGSTIPVW